mgnify:CR=1 FL=1
MKNIDKLVVDDFGKEWSKFDQSEVPIIELKNSFEKYFSLFPWKTLPANSEGFDLGCGSGRWAYFCAPLVGKLHCLDPSSSALNVAIKKLKHYDNCIFHNLGVDEIPFNDESMDFGYSLGVLHHIPDTLSALESCSRKLKKGAPFLVYLYYKFDNRGFIFKLIWRLSNLMRIIISRLPFPIKHFITDVLAIFIYFPLARLALIIEKLGVNSHSLPLSFYRALPLYTMRTDSLDRFGTKIEQRFSKNEIHEMMTSSNLTGIIFLEREPFWVAVGFKK